MVEVAGHEIENNDEKWQLDLMADSRLISKCQTWREAGLLARISQDFMDE